MASSTGDHLSGGRYERLQKQTENPFAALIPDQHIVIVPSFTLESGVILKNVPVAYSTKGNLAAGGDNAMVICHALTGSADVSDWWGPLLGGPGRAFDISRFFVVCLNSLGSPYGTASPVTATDGDSKLERYGPNFPLTTVRDDVNLHKLILDDLGVKQIAAVIGGSMGGMLVLEWAYFGKDYVRTIVPIATSSRHSAWCISWGETQRQSIYADPKYDDGYYSFDEPPTIGLGAARMAALLTYRSRNSFESRFGRNIPDPSRAQTISGGPRPESPADAQFYIHNDGHRISRPVSSRRNSHGSSSSDRPVSGSAATPSPRRNGSSTITEPDEMSADPQFHGPKATNGQRDSIKRSSSHYFSAQSYLRYQGAKFVQRFDSNCYIAITRKLDTHDISRGRADSVAEALALIQQPALVLGIESDGLFTFAEQQEIAEHIPNARLEKIDSQEGHDAFLLQFAQVNKYILEFLHEVLPDIMQQEGDLQVTESSVGELTKSSTFGEAEVEDITTW